MKKDEVADITEVQQEAPVGAPAEKEQKENRRKRGDGIITVKGRADFNQEEDMNKRIFMMCENRYEIFIHNVDYLLRKRNWSQARLCEELGNLLYTTQLATYKKPGRIETPNPIPFVKMAAVAALFGYTVEQICSELLDDPTTARERNRPVSARPPEECKKYYGTYEMAFFDTGKPLGANNRSTENSLAHGIMTVYPGNPVNGIPTLQVIAFVNCTDDEKTAIKSAITAALTASEKPDMYHCYESTAATFKDKDGEPRTKYLYAGNLVLTDRMADMMLHQIQGTDSAQIIAHNRAAGSSEGKLYRGGLATMMSISRGGEHMPCVQAMIISRRGFDHVSKEELANWLYLAPPTIDVSESVKAIISYMKLLYTDGGEAGLLGELSDEDKRFCLENFAEKKMTDSLRRNLVSYYKVSTVMDGEIYKALCC